MFSGAQARSQSRVDVPDLSLGRMDLDGLGPLRRPRDRLHVRRLPRGEGGRRKPDLLFARHPARRVTAGNHEV